MEFQPLAIPDVILITPRVFEDERGYFFESYKQDEFAQNGIHAVFVQENRSRSKKGVLRGLHFQKPPHAQDKLVSVTRGEILDVAVDIRKSSPSFGKWVGARLSEDNHQMLFIPKGFAHGFVALSDIADMHYKVSDVYNAASEGGVIWSDHDLGIDWGVEQPILSEKDAVFPRLKDLGEVFP
jgi:dTDP-4-dehydrorhamnose 3,5-epimerase